MPLPNFPVETWHMILQESIALPEIFNVDCLPEATDPLYKYTEDLSNSRNRSHSEYWETERRRNALRRVCKSWAVYLLRFEHRYVEIHDVLHNRVPKEALVKAIRIQYRPCSVRWPNPCSTCYDSESFSSISSAHTERLSTLIVDDRGNWSPPIRDLLVLMHANMSKLQAILSQNTYRSPMSGRWTPSPASCADLKVAQLDMWEQWTRVIGKTVVILSLPAYNQRIFAELEECSFPALRHFRVVRLSSIDYGAGDKILSLLKTIGSNIESLQLGSDYFHEEMPKELWEVCPRLKRLDSVLYITHAPPESHPLHTMSFLTPFSDASDEFLLPFYPNLEDFRSIRRLIARHSWTSIEDEVKEDRDVRSWFCSLVNACFLQGVRLEDSTGVSLEDSNIQGLLGI